MGRTISRPAAEARGLRPVTVSAKWLFEQLPADGSIRPVWQGFGQVRWVEQFSAQRMRRADDGHGVEVLRPEGSTWGRVLLVHPLGAERTVRTLVSGGAR